MSRCHFVLPVLALFVAQFAVSAEASNARSNRPLALVYQGPGACTRWDCHEAAAAVAYARGFDVKFVTPAKLTPEVFEGASLWIQPGGNAITVAKKLGAAKLTLIRKFVRYGGAYVGFCAGAFLADSTVDNEETIGGLGLLPVSTYDYDIDSGDDGIPMWINWNGQKRLLFFNGGGSFKTDQPGANKMNIFAWYPNGTPAAVETTYGLGGVVVTGAHPEAIDQWKIDAKFEDPDGSDLDLATGMIDRAFRLTRQQ